MTESRAPSKQEFQNQVFLGLEQKLTQTSWTGGLPEAHGLVCGLACLGTTSESIRPKAKLFQFSETESTDLLEGMIGLVCRELNDESLGFSLMLPVDDSSLYVRSEALSSWCQGFLQGICHDNVDILQSDDPTIREAMQDIIEIGHIEVDPNEPEQGERSLIELEQYLKVAVQLIHDELNSEIIQHPQSNPFN